MSSLERSILKTLSYFDIFDYPLTSWELYIFLYSGREYTYTEFLGALENAPVERRSGFYFLKGRGEIVSLRQQRYVENMYKMRRAKRIVRIFSIIPFIRMISVCNNLSFFNAKKESDLDFFIIVKKNALPFVRLIMVMMSSVLFKRPQVGFSENTVCLSFIVDTTQQSLAHMAFSKKDIYMSFWLLTVLPLYNFEDMQYQNFLEKNRNMLSMFPHYIPRNSKKLNIHVPTVVKQVLEFFFSPCISMVISKKLFVFQKARLPLVLSSAMNTSTSVMITPHIFKTHHNDQRANVLHAWKERIYEAPE